MTAAFVALSLGLAINSTGQGPGNAPQSAPYYIPQPNTPNGPQSLPYYYPYQKKHERHPRITNWILPPGPGDGWGFPNGFPDGYGWFDHSPYLPLNADRTAEYYFPRYYVVPPEQMFFPTYYNPMRPGASGTCLTSPAAGRTRPAGRRRARPTCRSGRMRRCPARSRSPRCRGSTAGAEAPFIPSGTSGLTP